MSEKTIYETADRQRDYVVFLEQVLKVCLRFWEKAGSGHRTIFFRGKNIGQEWFPTQGKGWADSLFSCVYDALLSESGALEISWTGNGDADDEIPLEEHLRIKTDLSATISESFTEKKIRGILEKLQSGFEDRTVIERLQNDSDNLFTIRRRLSTYDSVFDLPRKDVDNYLSAYYKFLFDLVLYYDTFNREEDRNEFIGGLLRLDAMFDATSDMYHLDFRSPIVLNKLQKVADGIEDFFERIQTIESDWLREIYKHIVLIKVQHDFRWYMPGPDWKLIHAAIAPFAENESQSLEFQVDACSLKHYNSYEGIGELRLGEKIIYECGLARNKAGAPYSVAIMGDLHAGPIQELYDYVCRKIKETSEDLTLEFNLYTKNRLDGLENEHIHSKGHPGAVLLNKEALDRVITENNLVFILDCIELYKSHVPQKEAYEFIKHKFAFNSYKEYGIEEKWRDICDKNKLEELYGILTCEQIFGQFGRITKQANDSLLEFCAEKQKSLGMKSTIYVYVSDMKAFENIYNDDQYYIRTERYNEKEIGIIRYSSEKVRKLIVGIKKTMLVFNVWQFIKNVAINERDLFVSYLNDLETTYMHLDQVYIGIDYTNWSNLLEVHYFCEGERFEELAVRFIDNVLLPVLNSGERDMFNQYIRKAMYSFFFSAAKSVNDMLFIHLFMNKADLLGKVLRPDVNDSIKVRENINMQYKFSSKRFYDMIMRNYDISSNMYIGQMRTAQIIQKSEKKENRIRKDEIYQNVITACKILSYDDSYLMKNCELELKGRY